ncbi:MAG: hypothetical protein H7124_07560 [Phycisphaerales bacterium]|nr:hypothetical protein [Hyphomonadaceae bacterium]
MNSPKFNEGQRVAVLRTSAAGAPNGVYRVITALPKEGGPRQYRVRSETENFDRVLSEVRLEAVSHEEHA